MEIFLETGPSIQEIVLMHWLSSHLHLHRTSIVDAVIEMVALYNVTRKVQKRDEVQCLELIKLQHVSAINETEK